MNETPPVCDYEGSDYRTRFWENENRNYEDRVERVALQRLMPATGKTLIEIGAGFGRLAEEYLGYERVVLFDYSRTLLYEAQERWGKDKRFIYVAGDWYKMPFVEGLFDTMVQIRTIHHAADVPALLAQLQHIARPNGDYILEFANKRNLKAILRYSVGQQQWSPYEREPIEFVKLNFDFHPQWIQEQLRQYGFVPDQILTVSHFRIPFIKRLVPTPLLVQLDSLAQRTGKWWQLSPSVFVHSKVSAEGVSAQADTFFVCPEDQTPLPFTSQDGLLRCLTCGRRWQAENGFYDFKESV